MTVAAPTVEQQDGISVPVHRMLALLPTFVLPAAAGFITAACMARLFGPAGFGSYALAAAVIALSTSVCGDWLGQVVIRFVAALSDAHRVRKLAIVTLASAAVAAVTTMLLRGATAQATAPVALAAGVGVLSRPVMAQLRAHGAVKRYVRISLTSGILVPLAGLLAAICLHSPLAYFWSLPAVLSVQIVLALVPWRRPDAPSAEVPAASADVVDVRIMLRFGLPIAITAMGSQALAVGDRIMIEHILSPTDVGMYSAAYVIGEKPIFLLSGPLVYVLQPLLIRAWEAGDTSRVGSLLRRAQEAFCLIGGSLLPVVALVSTPGMGLFGGEAFRAGAYIVPLVFFAMLAWNVGMLIHQPLELALNTKAVTVCVLGAAVLNVALNLLLLPVMGLAGAVVATVASYVCYPALAFAMVRRRGLPDPSLPVRHLVVGLATGTAFAVPALALCRRLDSDVLSLIVGGLTGAVALLITWVVAERSWWGRRLVGGAR